MEAAVTVELIKSATFPPFPISHLEVATFWPSLSVSFCGVEVN